MPKLIVEKGEREGTVYPVGEKLSIGRRKECDITLADGLTSRTHAEIWVEGGRYYAKDLKNRNGTTLNGEALTQRRLTSGDKLTVGETTFIFEDEQEKDLVGQTVGGYVILEKIGEGGMGSVYKARQVSMDRVVALKVLSERLVETPGFVDRFINEARAAGRLNHPNVIQVHDVCRTAETFFFSMEYVDGPTVGALLKGSGPLPLAEAVRITSSICEALEYAHQNSVVHRDVKPENIMVAKGGRVKLADLGLAKTPKEDLGFVQSRADGRKTVWGTPQYMSPEQALGRDVDHRSDIYSLGATLFHMLGGRAPYVGRSSTDILEMHVRYRVPDVTDLNRDVPEGIANIISKMMAKNPEERHQTPREVIEELRTAQPEVEQAAQKAAEEAPPKKSGALEAFVATRRADESAGVTRARRRRPGAKPSNPLIEIFAGALLAVALIFLFIAAQRAGREAAKFFKRRSSNDQEYQSRYASTPRRPSRNLVREPVPSPRRGHCRGSRRTTMRTTRRIAWRGLARSYRSSTTVPVMWSGHTSVTTTGTREFISESGPPETTLM